MATQQQQKAELIAIYRLEFYKKQKNWKLSTDARKEKNLRNSYPIAPIKNNKILNETYSIDTNIENDPSELNDAFLKDQSDKDAPVSPTIYKSLHTQSLEPINACQECNHADFKPQNPWADYVDDGVIDDRCSGDGNDYEEFDGWAEGMVWTNSDFLRPEWVGAPEASIPINLRSGEHPERLAWPPDDVNYHQLTPWPDDQIWIPNIWEGELLVESLESVNDFMIGAHSAPHSSEIDLCVRTECEGENGVGGGGPVSLLSGAALAAAVRSHSGSLRRLLREAGRRRVGSVASAYDTHYTKYRSTLSLDVCALDHFGIAPRQFFSTECSYDAIPSRDVPSAPLSPVYMSKDRFTPPPARNVCMENFTHTTNQCQSTCAPLPLDKQCWNAFNLMSPVNLQSDGFVAGSHRSTVPLSFAGRGRGRGRLLDRGVEE